MKSFIKLFVIFSVFLLPSLASASDDKNRIDQMRVININLDDFSDEYEKAMSSDDLEGYNKAIFSFNQTIDDYFAKPLARGYRHLMPEWGRNRVLNFFKNLTEPQNVVNSALQGDTEGVFRGFWRFTINSTLGIGGLHDFAGGFGLTERSKDFSQTLAVWGVDSGDYFVLPFLGPSTYRDAVGLAFDKASDPSTYVDGVGASVALTASDIISTRESLLDITDDLEDESFDLYSSYKSGYLQNRKKSLISNL